VTDGEWWPCDVDGDGNLDLVGVSSSQLAVRRGRGDGTFAATPILTNGSSSTAYGVFVADLDGDGRCDVGYNLLATAGATTRTYEKGMTDATFQAVSQFFSSPFGTSAGNVQGLGVANPLTTAPQALFLTWTAAYPGKTDFGVTAWTGGVSSVAWSDSGLSTGSAGRVYGGAIGDVDGDHHDDVLASYFWQPASGAAQPPQVVLMKGNGSSYAAAAAIRGLAGYTPYRVYDLDQDGFADVAATSIADRSSQVFWGDSSLSFAAATPLYVSEKADFDADGNLDVYVNTSQRTCISFGAGGRTFGHRMLVSPVELSSAADFNKDGVADLMSVASTSSLGGVVSIYLSTAKTTPGAPDIQCGSLSTAECAGPTGL